mmetsp:Transcript_54539/g.133709  ORF Transcript_54539/g.133709 Transcript_54539/m.133709 type:complete len:254 (-) Transcript_54539:45-806(-)
MQFVSAGGAQCRHILHVVSADAIAQTQFAPASASLSAPTTGCAGAPLPTRSRVVRGRRATLADWSVRTRWWPGHVQSRSHSARPPQWRHGLGRVYARRGATRLATIATRRSARSCRRTAATWRQCARLWRKAIRVMWPAPPRSHTSPLRVQRRDRHVRCPRRRCRCCHCRCCCCCCCRCRCCCSRHRPLPLPRATRRRRSASGATRRSAARRTGTRCGTSESPPPARRARRSTVCARAAPRLATAAAARRITR